MARTKIYKDLLRCRSIEQHGAHEWYGNLTADDKSAFHACSGIAWDMAGWFKARGVRELAGLEAVVREFADHTEAQMDRMYEALHEGCNP